MFVIFDLYGSSTNYVQTLLENNEVRRSLKNYIVVRLRCDDRSIGTNGATIGRVNAHLEIQKAGLYTQPLFCFFDCDGNLVGKPWGYSPKSEIIEYLKNQLTHLCQ